MTIVRVGSNQKYSEGWEAAFSKGKTAAAKPAPKASAKKKASQKSKHKKKK